MPRILAMAFRNVWRTSPMFPPSAIRTSAMGGWLARAGQDHADIVEDRGDRGVRFVHGYLDCVDAGKGCQDGVGHGAGGAFQQLVIGVLEGRRRGRHHVGVGHGIGETISPRGFREVGGKLEVDHEPLADFGLMVHDAVAGMDDDAGDEDQIGHALSSIARATRSACTVSATSWVRMIRAPPLTAIRCAAIEPPIRCCGSDGPTELMKRLRDAPTSSGNPKRRSSSRRASAVMLCSWVLPKPMPGSSTMRSAEMPALAAISSERSKKAAISFMISRPASALSRLCMMTTGTLRLATSAAISRSRCRPQTSLAMVAPASSAQATTADFMLSIDTGIPSETISGRIGCRRFSSSAAGTGCAP